MIGTIANALAIIVGGIIGLLFKNIIPEKISEALLKAIGLAVIGIGINLMLSGENFTLLIISMVIGTIIGEGIDIEKKLDKIGAFIESKMKNKESNVALGFVACTLVYCVGSMAIVGSIQSGLTGNHEILFSKAVLDGITAVTFAATMGVGVVFSGISVLVYQGTITMLASIMQSLLNPVVVSEMTAIGGVIIMGIGLNFLISNRMRVGNMLPSIFIPIIYYMILMR
ncbi:MAG: DUF554 domain-containing protein [Bacillota bacterium]|jgi:uncharacterized membrane protein YqgA involved in biofilm formation|nr:DUF554 domain-containing protein [Sedimentibacter sp.]MDI9495972.1 DUF554 domain-containing protein [Bacillota bacterium]HAS91197.1 DUF554 domain-containing protein [Clostridiales bacterium]HQG38867.1 DUF554 domain-containing protein [Chitinophagales bacterium]HOA19768.1 DUF554 domain-containing protein [Sedimentibacter sp.]